MRLSLVFATLVVLVVLFHIPTWMMLIHRHNPTTDAFISDEIVMDESRKVIQSGNFYRDDSASTLTLRNGQPFEELRKPDLNVVNEAELDSKRLLSPLVLVELSPEDASSNFQQDDSERTVIVQHCFECVGSSQSGMPWHLLSRCPEWFGDFGNVEVLIVTRLHRLFSVAQDDDRGIVQQLVKLKIDPSTLTYTFRANSTTHRLRFRIFSVQQRGMPSTRNDCHRYSWDLLYRLGLRVAESREKPKRVVFNAPAFLPPQGSFARHLLEVETNETITSCLVSRPRTLDGTMTLLHDGFEIFSGLDDLPSIFPRFSGMSDADPRIEASRNLTLLVASPMCFATTWTVFERLWPQQLSIEPRTDESLSIFDDLKSFLRFALDASAANVSTVSTNAAVRSALPITSSLRSWAAAVEALAGPIECSELASAKVCEEAVTRRWKHRNEFVRRDFFVEWDTFCVPCFGFTNEVMHFVKPLEDRVNLRVPMNADCFCPGTPQYFSDSLNRITANKPFRTAWKNGSSFVYVSHKDPGSYLPSMPNPRPDIVIGRSMYEFNVLPSQWQSHENEVDEIWVPSRFVRWVFQQNGFAPSRIVVIPEPIDVFFFDPATTRPLNLPFPHGHAPWRRKSNLLVTATSLNKSVNASRRCEQQSAAAQFFKFLSVFKWESRKGPDILFQSYFESFTSTDHVSLYLVSYIYGDNGRDPQKIMNEIKKIFEEVHSKKGSGARWPEDAPHVEVISDQLPELILASLYRSADCFVFPTRGEGWGLPIVQAMSMALPTIATNFSGNVDFLTSDNSYLIPIERLEVVPAGSPYGDGLGKMWAAPSARKLSELMLHVFRNPKQALFVGQQARRDIVSQYSEEAVAEIVLDRLRKVVSRWDAKRAALLSDRAKERLHEFLDDKNAHLMF